MMMKFNNPETTLDGAPRARVHFKSLKTLWFNTGTLCNLSCENCYIESTPRNDRLVYLTCQDVLPYLDEIEKLGETTKEIGFTGGEPFLNPHFVEILHEVLKRDFNILILTNGLRAINRFFPRLIELNKLYPHRMVFRVSLDHYTESVHEKERGKKTFSPVLKTLQWLDQNQFRWSIAGRTLIDEVNGQQGYQQLMRTLGLELQQEDLVLFPEMEETQGVPEVTMECYSLLGINPDDLMCATSRMVVKRKGESKSKVLPCTLLAYDTQFELGTTLEEANSQVVKLNHPFCAQFCILGGSSCTGSKKQLIQ